MGVENMPEDLKGLTKNPLGIVALFIALIYGFATLLLGVAANQLSPEERQPLIWFVVLFPIVVLGVFYVLVTRHHGKLYAPKDYQNDDSFLMTLSEKQQAERLDDEIQQTVEDVFTRVDVKSEATDDSQEVMFSRTNQAADKYENDKINSYVSLRNKYRQAERFALLKLELDEGFTFKRQVSFGDDSTTAFDGVSINGNVVTAVEVKYLRRPTVSRAVVREILYKGILAEAQIGNKRQFKLFIVMVLEDRAPELLESLKSRVSDTVKNADFPVEVRLFYYDELVSEYEETTKGSW
jgi:hypothetical protein